MARLGPVHVVFFLLLPSPSNLPEQGAGLSLLPFRCLASVPAATLSFPLYSFGAREVSVLSRRAAEIGSAATTRRRRRRRRGEDKGRGRKRWRCGWRKTPNPLPRARRPTSKPSLPSKSPPPSSSRQNLNPNPFPASLSRPLSFFCLRLPTPALYLFQEQGNQFVKMGKKHYADAVDRYTRAIDQKVLSDSDNSTLFANRAHVNLLLGNYRRALTDAEEAIRLCPSNLKVPSFLAASRTG